MRHRRRRLHKRLALHASSIALLLGGSFLPPSFMFEGQTFSYDVTAKVSAPALTEPAVITTPQDLQHVTTQPITVSGTCPSESYVVLHKNGADTGMAVCDNGNFIFTQVTLTPGVNQLLVKVFNITDDEGPASPPITVYYDPPSPAPMPTQPPQTSTPPFGQTPASPAAATPLSVSSLFLYEVHFPGEPWEWSVLINGGTAPYTITIAWGDGSQEHIRHTGGPLQLRHTYSQPDTYQPIVRVTDSNGTIATLQLLAIVKDRGNIIVQTIAQQLNNVGPWLAWPVYTMVIVAILLFWVWEATRLAHYLHSRSTRRRHV